MNLKISYKHLDSSDAINAKINEKMTHLEKFFTGNVEAHWVCSVDGHDQHTSEVQVNVNGHKFHAHATDSNLYHTLDVAVEKLESQLRKDKEKRKDHRH